MSKMLTPDAQSDRNDFERLFAFVDCCCYLYSGPCARCTHPGNPVIQAEDELCWMEECEIGDSCGYQGKHFGAWYDDATCINGYLWDMDSCDEPGGALHSGGDTACPCCNTREYVADIRPLPGSAKQRRRARRVMMRQVWAWAGREPLAGLKKGTA